MSHTPDEIHALAFYTFQVQPLLKHLYKEAKLTMPRRFDYLTEAPRLEAALREQGFDLHFIDMQGEEVL